MTIPTNRWARRIRAAVLLATPLILAVTISLSVMRHSTAQQASPPPSAAAVPVSVTKAQLRDVPLWLRGLGTVQALNAVTVRARVDGTLMRVPVAEGQIVAEGTLLAVIDPRPYQAVLDQAMAKKAQDEAQLANARLDLQRYSSLARQDFASHQQVDTQVAMVNQFTAALKGDDATIEAAQLNLSYCYITAPFNGRIGLRLVDPGNLVHANDAGGILTINQVQPITVIFTLPQRNLPPIVNAMSQGSLTVTAWSGDDKSQLAKGELLTPDNTIDTATGTIRLKAQFSNQDNKLWPGQFVDVGLLLQTDRHVVTVPNRAVQHSQTGLYVYIVKPGSTVERQPIEGEPRDDVLVISKGLNAGQEVVLDGQSRLENGARIAVNNPAAASAPAPGGS